jgi:hypothetical protein
MARKNSSNPKQDLPSCLERLRNTGCEVRELGAGRFLVSRQGCATVLLDSGNGVPQVEVRPGLVQGDGLLHLVDHGFQKFWQNGNRKVPARAEELKALHEFERDLRAALGVIVLYNEALGTVSAKYVYDRLEGREPGKRHPSFD